MVLTSFILGSVLDAKKGVKISWTFIQEGEKVLHMDNLVFDLKGGW